MLWWGGGLVAYMVRAHIKYVTRYVYYKADQCSFTDKDNPVIRFNNLDPFTRTIYIAKTLNLAKLIRTYLNSNMDFDSKYRLLMVSHRR